MGASIICVILQFSDDFDTGFVVVTVILTLVAGYLIIYSLLRVAIMSVQAITLAKTGIADTQKKMANTASEVCGTNTMYHFYRNLLYFGNSDIKF